MNINNYIIRGKKYLKSLIEMEIKFDLRSKNLNIFLFFFYLTNQIQIEKTTLDRSINQLLLEIIHNELKQNTLI